MTMDEISLEQQIKEELAALDVNVADVATECVDETNYEGTDDNLEGEDLPSMMEFVSKMREQTDNLEKELLECDVLLSHSSKGTPNEYLKELADGEGVDAQTLKQQVLSELEEEERKEGQMQLSSVAHTVVNDLLIEAQSSTSRTVSTDTTNPTVQDPSPVEIPQSTGTTGVISVIAESESLEHQLLQDVLALDQRNLSRHQHWIQEKQSLAAANAEREKQSEEKRLESRVALEQQQHQHSLYTLQKEEDFRQENDRLQAEILQSVETFEHDLAEMSQQVEQETQKWKQALRQEEARKQQFNNLAATTIQRHFRGHRARKTHGAAVQAVIKEVKVEREAQHIQELEILIEERQWRERRKKAADERKQLQEAEEKRLQDEKQKKKQEEREWLEQLEVRKKEEERKRKEEDKHRKEEEQKRKEEEKKQKVEEKKQKVEEKRKKDEDKKRKKDENKRKEEEKCKKQKEEEKKVKEEMEKVAEEVIKQEKMTANKERKEKVEREAEVKENTGDLKKMEKEQMDEGNTKNQGSDQNVNELPKLSAKDKTKALETPKKDLLNSPAATHSKNSVLESKSHTGETKAIEASSNTNSASVIVKPENDMNIVGQHFVAAERGVTDLLIDTVCSANGISPEVLQTSRKVIHKTPRPPIEEKVSSVVYERPRSAKQQSNTPRKSQDSNSLKSLCVGTSMRKEKAATHKVEDSRKGSEETCDWGEFLPPSLDGLRLAWIKECRPLSKLLSGENKENRKILRLPQSAKNLPALKEEVVVMAAAVSSLREVNTVSLGELPGCTLATLHGCPHLQVLSVTDSHLPSTDGLSACTHLKQLCITRSGLIQLSLRDLAELVYVDVSHNSLTALTGLEGCTSLRHLNAAHNKITRLGDLCVRDLHTLDVSSNQLVTTRGLGLCVGLQHVNLSHNHLSLVDDLVSLPLLQDLDVSHNTLMQVPALSNQVLLQKLNASDNNISFLAPLMRVWLPLLTHLLLDNNSVNLLVPLVHLLLLEQLQLANNQVSDLSGMAKALVKTRCLHCVTLKGNPVCEDTGYREESLLALPYLYTLDGCAVSQRKTSLHRTEFERLCQSQVEQIAELSHKYKQGLQKTCSLSEQVQIHKKYFETSHQMATDFRYTHEYGVSMVPIKAVDMNFERQPLVTAPENLHSDAADMKSKFEAALKGHQSAKSTPLVQKLEPANNSLAQSKAQSSAPSPCVQFEQNLMKSMTLANQSSTNKKLPPYGTNTAHYSNSTVLTNGQTCKEVRDGLKIGEGGMKVDTNNCSPRVDANKVNRLLKQNQPGHVMNQAAIKIQAWWRGVHLRKQFDLALTYARLGDLDDLDSLGEIDLGELDFIMADLDKDLQVPDTPALSHSCQPVLGKSPSVSPGLKPKPLMSMGTESPNPQEPTKIAWRHSDSPLSGRPPLPPLSRLSDNASCDTHRSKKTDRIAEDWGFKNMKTAELMAARAKKLKYNAAKKQKLSELDPKQRLALFRKLGENSNLRVVLQPRKQLPRKEYFKAREVETRPDQFQSQIEQQEKSDRTFEWVHTQVEMDSRRVLNRSGIYGSEGSLPRMEPSVIAGQTRLIGSPIDLQSVESSSTLGEPAVKPRKLSRNSAGSGERLPPIQLNSGSTQHVKERMSFRNPQTTTDIGWGGGKKRGKHL